MIHRLLNLLKKEYQTLNKIEILRQKLLANFRYLSSLDKRVRVAPVLKSNAYGHGILEVAKILDGAGAPFFCVDSLYEAYELLKIKIMTPVLIMGYTNPENFKVKKLPFSFAVFDLEMAKILNDYQPGCAIHLFVDTGMHREGVPLNDLPRFIEELKRLPNIKIEGLMSHLSSVNKTQIKKFKKAREVLKKYGIRPKWVHLLNSEGLLQISGVGNLARVGLALYGISDDANLKPILSFKTKIIQIKKLQKGDKVGYSGTFTAKGPMILGVLPAGYYDGVDLRLSNKGQVLVDGQLCRIVGQVSMNITTVDLTKVPNPYIGQEVVIFSKNRNDPNSIENATRICQTIPYDILISLAASTKRVIV